MEASVRPPARLMMKQKARHDRQRKLAALRGKPATRRGFDELRLVIMGLEMVDYVRVAATSGCPVAARLIHRWDGIGRQ